MITAFLDALLPCFYRVPRTCGPYVAEELIESARLALATGGAGGVRFRRLARDLVEIDHPVIDAWFSLLYERAHPASEHPYFWWLWLRRSLRGTGVIRFVFV